MLDTDESISILVGVGSGVEMASVFFIMVMRHMKHKAIRAITYRRILSERCCDQEQRN